MHLLSCNYSRIACFFSVGHSNFSIILFNKLIFHNSLFGTSQITWRLLETNWHFELLKLLRINCLLFSRGWNIHVIILLLTRYFFRKSVYRWRKAVDAILLVALVYDACLLIVKSGRCLLLNCPLDLLRWCLIPWQLLESICNDYIIVHANDCWWLAINRCLYLSFDI